jgi:hypothetical protein
MELSLKIPVTEKEIREEVKRLTEEIKIRKSEIEILQTGVRHYQRQCKHPGQKTGHNERDGNWGSPCPICDYSY